MADHRKDEEAQAASGAESQAGVGAQAGSSAEADVNAQAAGGCCGGSAGRHSSAEGVDAQESAAQDTGKQQNLGTPTAGVPEESAQENAEAGAQAGSGCCRGSQNADASAINTDASNADTENAGAQCEKESAENSDATENAEPTEPSVESQLAERTEDLQRLSAEYTNYRRRVERDRVAVIASAKADVAANLLPIIDDLELAEQHGDMQGPLKAVADKVRSVLSSLNVEQFGAEGEPFDPELHEAVQDSSSGEEKILGTVLRKGYRSGDRILRNAMVIIADPA